MIFFLENFRSQVVLLIHFPIQFPLFLIAIKNSFNKRFHLGNYNMIEQQDLRQYLLRCTKQLGQNYNNLIPIINSSSWVELQHILLAQGKLEPGQSQHQTTMPFFFPQNINFLINAKLTKISREPFDLRKLIPALKILYQTFQFKLEYECVHELSTDIFAVYEFLNFCGQNQASKRLLASFLTSSVEALYSQTPNKESYSFKCLQAMSEDQRRRFSIIAVNGFNQFNKDNHDESKNDIVFEQCINTSDPQTFTQLLSLRSDKMEEVKNSICELKLVQKEGKWQFEGECRVDRRCLTPEILVKTLSSSSLVYRHLANSLFLSTECEVIFKYDVELMLRESQQRSECFFNAKTKIKKEANLSQIQADFESFIGAAYTIIESIQQNKKMLKLVGDCLVELSNQKAHLLCLKLLTYPFRTKGTFQFELQNVWDDNPVIQFGIDSEQLRAAFSKVLRYYLQAEKTIEPELLNALCEVIRWANDSSAHKELIKSVFSNESSEKNINPFFIQFLAKYLEANPGKRLPYHAGIWMVGYLTTELVEGRSALFYPCLYSFLVQHHRYLSVQEFELDCYNYQENYKLNFYKLVESFLACNAGFPAAIFESWTQELEWLSTDTNFCRKDRRYRLAMLAITFNDQNFPATPPLKERLRRLLDLEDFETMQFSNKYGYIWEAFLKKTDFDLAEEFELALSHVLASSQDHEIMGSNWRLFRYRSGTPEGMRGLVRAVTRLSFLLKVARPQPSEAQVVRLVDVMFNLAIIQGKYQEQLERASQEYALAQLDWLKSVQENHLLSFLAEKFTERFQIIADYLTAEAFNTVVSNAIVVRLGGFLKYVIENHGRPLLVSKVLTAVVELLRKKSQKTQCELFLQFYNYHKELILELLQLVFTTNNLKYESDNQPSPQKDQVHYALKMLKQGRSVKESWEALNRSLLEAALMKFVQEVFTNENWEYTVLLNNTKYQKTNNMGLFQKTAQEDLARRVERAFQPEKIRFYHRLFKIIDDSYHLRSREDLECARTIVGVEIPSEPLVLMTRTAELQRFYQSCKSLLLKLFEHWEAYEAAECFEELYNILASQLPEEEKANIQKELIQKLINHLSAILASPHPVWGRYEKIHAYINSVVESFNDPIGTLLSQDFVEAYLAKISQNISKSLFTAQNSKHFIKFVERMIPDSKPEASDEEFSRYARQSVQIFVRLLNAVKFEELQSTIISLIAKMVRIRDPFFDEYLIQFFQKIKGLPDTYSELFCELIETQLRSASIEAQIKSYFFKLYESNKGSGKQIRVKLSLFASVFSKKYGSHKKEFIKVAERLTSKITVKQQGRSSKYLEYKASEKFEYSLFLGTDFMHCRHSSLMKSILSSFINSVNASQKQAFGRRMKELRVISFNYPILTCFILMHPRQLQEKTVPFVDYLVEAFACNDLGDDAYASFAYLCLDIGLIIKLQDQVLFFSEYLCYRIVCRLVEGELSSRKLVFIFYMTKIRRFADLCFKKIKDNKSLVDLLWAALPSFRQDFTFQNHLSILTYIILVVLYRQDNVAHLLQYCQYKRSADEWENYSNIVNLNWLPFKNLVLRKKPEQTQEFAVAKDREIKHRTAYEQFEATYEGWYASAEKKEEQESQVKQQTSSLPIRVGGEHLKRLGSVARTHAQEYRDIESQISTSYFQTHRLAFEAVHLFFLDHGSSSTMLRRRSRMKDCAYTFFEELQEESEACPESSQDEEHQDEFNANRQSHFAPEEFVRVRSRKPSEDGKSEDLEKELELKLNELSRGPLAEDQVVEEKPAELTSEMLQTLGKINERLGYLQRPALSVAEVQGRSLAEKAEFLQGKDLETDFDVKEATMGVDQFQDYCLANVSRLERLGSERRNVVHSIEDAMLMKFVQRSVSSDSVDYIIDTIDENYQLLPNTLPSKHSAANEDKEGQEGKEGQEERAEAKVAYIDCARIPLENYEDIAEERLYELFLTLYFPCGLFPSVSFVPFLENRRVQEKVVNTLLYIYRNPFGNGLFPTKPESFDLENLKWSSGENSESAAEDLRQRIADIFMAGKSSAFYEESCYLNREIGLSGIRDIVYEPSVRSTEASYRPIFEVLEVILSAEIKKLEKDEEYECGNVMKLFSGVCDLVEPLLEKLLVLLKKVHEQMVQGAKNESEHINSDEMSSRARQAKLYNIEENLRCLLGSQKVRELLKSAFPLEAEDRNAFFVSLFMNTGVYSREELLKFHREVVRGDVASSFNMHFANLGFGLYSEEELRECSWVRESRNIMPCVVKSLPRRALKLAQQPFYRLCAFPAFLLLEVKAELLYRKVQDYKQRVSFHGSEEVVAQRKRGIFESAFLDLRNRPDGFWFESFSVKFMNEAGALESGYGRGVAKDWYAFVTRGMANLNYGIFMRSSKNYYFFNRESWINPRHLQFLEFIGKLFALSILNREFFLAPSFSILIYKMIAGEQILIADIVKEFDEGEVIKNIEKLRHYHDDSLFCESFVYEDKRLISNRNLEILKRKRSVESVEASREGGLYLLQEAVEMKEEAEEEGGLREASGMEEQMEEQAPKMIKVLKIGESIELLPGGAQIAVNKDNLEQFIALTKQKIYDIIVNGVQQQFAAFMSGFRRVVKPEFIQNITAEELRQIAEGCDKISVEDLRKHVNLGRNVDSSSPQMQWFWSCLEALSARDRMYLIQHWTGLPKISAEGFKGTNLTIVKGQYNGRLFAQTCFNKLHLPEFESREKMAEAITMVINSVKIGESIIED